MKLLLDENIPHDLRHSISGHDVFTVAYMGWRSYENGHLLEMAASTGFNAIITKDSGVEYQQHLPDLPLTVIVLRTKTNKIDDLLPLVPALMSALADFKPRSVIRIG